MQLIKIDPPIQNGLSTNSLSESECNELMNSIQEYLLTTERSSQLVKENKFTNLSENGSFIQSIIDKLTDIVSSKYRLTTRKLLNQSKELNDLYIKIDDLLRHDREARLKHQNDLINTELRTVVLKDSREKNKDYKITTDFIAYNPEYFIDEINEIMQSISPNMRRYHENIKIMQEEICDMIDRNFAKHDFIKYYTPLIKVVKQPNMRLETAIIQSKNIFSDFYQSIYVYNNYISTELQYLQLLHVGYNRMLASFKDNKDGKQVTDTIFKKLVDNVKMSIDYNSKIMTALIEVIHFYAKELSKIYDIIRS